MKTRSQILLWTVALLSMVLPISARGIGDIRVDARFLTDRMAFELNLNTNQYDDLYEVNYDFLRNVDPYLSDMARQDAYALDCYYRYLDERNDDLRWIFSNAEYMRFLAMDYFFRPVYVLNNLCHLRVYQRYSDRNRFYFNRPVHYMSYRGGHSRAYWRGASFYERNFVGRYHHSVYRGDCHIRPEHRRGDFAPVPPRPGKPGVGSHFPPAQPPRPGRPEMGNQRPYVERYRSGSNNRPGVGNRDAGRESVRKDRKDGGRPSARPDMSRPSRDNGRYGSPNRSTSRQQDSPSWRPGYRDNRSVGSDECRNNKPENHRHPAQSDSRFLREM